MKTLYTITIILFSFVILKAAPLNGSYTIDAGSPTGSTNFQSFNDLADSLNLNGISGNVIVTVVPGSGPYNESVSFENVQGTSSGSTVVIDGSYETITFLTDSAMRYILRLRNVQYFTINNLHVERQIASTSGFYGIHILESGNNITISNCLVDMSGSTSTLIGGIIASGSPTSILVEGDFHDLVFDHDTCTGGGYGISVFGLPSLAKRILISDNVFYDFHSNGIYIRESDSTVIARNYFDKRTANVTSVNAIQIAQNANINANIYSNMIKVSQTSNGTQTFRGIYLFNGTGHKVYNNVISEINLTSGNFTAIEVRSASTSPEIYFNTISIDKPDSTTGELFGIVESLSNTGTKLLNNMISITQPTSSISSALSLASNSTVTTAFVSDYNNFWVPGGSVAYKSSINPVNYSTLTDWQNASTQDANSFSVDPLFVSFSSSIPGSSVTDNMGSMVSYISQDILGVSRNVPPDIGAYEYIVTGESYLSQDKLFFVYPNPVQSALQIQIKEGEGQIAIFSATGKEMFSTYDQSPSNRFSIDMEGFSSGMYFAIIKMKSSLINRIKILKL